MKVSVVRHHGEWGVKLSHGVQSFLLAYGGTKAECVWYARMVRLALEAHDREKAHEKEPTD